MKIGFVTSILDHYDLEGVLSTAASMGFECLEVACWPEGTTERRYAGVSHIDVVDMNDDAAEKVLQKCSQAQIEISALAYYPNVLDSDEAKAQKCIQHLCNVIRASHRLGVDMVTTFIGRNQYMTVEENLDLVKEYWPPILKLAQDLGVKIAIENCPMLFGADQWPGGQNLMTTPVVWDKIFEILPNDNLGINYDPSHFIWQMMDYIQPLYDFRDRLMHVHCKDIKLYPEKLRKVGTMAYPLEYMSPKIPGLGNVDWSKYISALMDIGYDGNICIEIEDRAFEGSQEKILDSLRLSRRYLKQFLA